MNKVWVLVFSVFIASNIFLSPAYSASSNDKSDSASSDNKNEDPDYIMDTSRIGQTEGGVIRSEQLLELGSPTPCALSIEGEQSLREGSIDRALTVLQRSVEMAPLDMDSRILYAQTLEKKLMMQKDKKDPRLYNFIVKQWFFVYKKSDFFDQSMQGLSRIIDMTGTRPKRFENEQKFLARVLIPEDGSVKVALGGRADGKDKNKKVFDPDADLKKDKEQ